LTATAIAGATAGRSALLGETSVVVAMVVVVMMSIQIPSAGGDISTATVAPVPSVALIADASVMEMVTNLPVMLLIVILPSSVVRIIPSSSCCGASSLLQKCCWC